MVDSSSLTGEEPIGEPLEARELRAYLRAVGDTLRLQILRGLAQRPGASVTELARALRVSQPLLSWHLGVLRRAELVSVRRQGRVVHYSLDRAALRAYTQRLDAWLEGSLAVSHEREGGEDE